MDMANPAYGFKRTVPVPVEEADRQVREALQAEGFGILTEIDVRATMKKKLDVDFRNYRILGACNPPLAHRALSGELLIGLLLPCNVVVFEQDDGTVTVSAVKPAEMFKVVDNPGLESIAGEVQARLRRAIEAV